MINMDPQSVYIRLGRLLETMPDLKAGGDLSRETLQWLGRAAVLVEAAGNISDSATFNVEVAQLKALALNGFGPHPADKIALILYRALARSEAMAPPGVSGTFIPVGNKFDAFAAISKIMQEAKKDILILDPYMDEKVLTEFGMAAPEHVKLRLLTDAKEYKPSLAPAAKAWVDQYAGQRPLEVRLAPAKSLHDRAIFIDGKTAWTLTQSLNNLAGRSPAEIIRADDTAAMKIVAYEAVWAKSVLL